MDRRTLLINAPAVALAATVPASSAPLIDLYGLPLAAELGRQAAAAMADPCIMGCWELSIVSGDADQRIFFRQIGEHPISKVRRRAEQLRHAMEMAYGGDFAVLSPDESGVAILRLTGGR